MDTSDKSGITDRVSRCRVGGGINSGFNRPFPLLELIILFGYAARSRMEGDANLHPFRAKR